MNLNDHHRLFLVLLKQPEQQNNYDDHLYSFQSAVLVHDISCITVYIYYNSHSNQVDNQT